MLAHISFLSQGFAEIDPFLPIEVPNYSEKEVYSCLEYYMDRMWIQRPEGNSFNMFQMNHSIPIFPLNFKKDIMCFQVLECLFI